MHNWYQKVADLDGARRWDKTKDYEVSQYGFVFTVSYNSVLVDFRITEAKDVASDSLGLSLYAELTEDQFTEKIKQEIESRLSNFGVVKNPIFIIVNGVRFTVNVSTENPYSNDWTVEGAKIIDEDLFLKTLPPKVVEHVIGAVEE